MDFKQFKDKMRQNFGLDLHSYKETQLKRRMDNLMVRMQARDYDRFLQILQRDRQAYERFLDTLTINVSEFFRDPKMFDFLETQILPELLRSRPALKIWSAACSNGCEPYSLAILLDEQSPSGRHIIDATDIDQNILAEAARGRYKNDALKNVSSQRLTKYFQPEGDGWVIREFIRSKVKFRQHDLLTEEYRGDYDLIVCRNVTIYFTREAQDRIYQKFQHCLTPGGVLFTGGSETVFNYQSLGLGKIAPCFYRKI